MSSIEDTLTERGGRYGDFFGHAMVAMSLKRVIEANLASRKKRLADDQQQALDTICDKIARIINGDPNYIDNWHDIAGYATLVEKRLAKDALASEPPKANPVPVFLWSNEKIVGDCI